MKKLCLIIVLLALVSPAPILLAQDSIATGEKIKDFEFYNYKHELVRLYDFKESIVLLVFWNVKDQYSKEALIAIETVNKRFADKEFIVLAIELSAHSSEALMFLARNDLNFVFAEGVLDRAIRDYNLAGTPTMFLLDKTMTIQKYYEGYEPGTEDRIATDIEHLLTN